MNKSAFAPFWTRLLAHNIDLILLLGLAYGLAIFMTNDLILYGTLAAVYILYHTLTEISSWKGSIGKRLLNIQVTPLQGVTNSLPRSLLRNTLKVLSVGLLFGGFLMIRFNMKKQGLHDWLSGSVVILG